MHCDVGKLPVAFSLTLCVHRPPEPSVASSGPLTGRALKTLLDSFGRRRYARLAPLCCHGPRTVWEVHRPSLDREFAVDGAEASSEQAIQAI
jgi:hypothetical protein